MTKRMLIYALVGPFIGYLVMVAGSGGHRRLVLDAILIGLPILAAIWLIPLLLCALLDFFMERACWWERLFAVTMAGFATGWIGLFAVVPGLAHGGTATLLWGANGALAAAICSLLSNWKRKATSSQA